MHGSLVLALLVCSLGAPPSTQPAAGDEDAIRDNIARYVEAYNRGDLQKVASMYAKDAEYRIGGGTIVRGRDAILKRMQENFKPSTKLEVKVDSIRFTRPGMAIERGAATITPGDDEPIIERYRVVHVLKDGKWEIQSVGEDSARGQAVDSDALDLLEWMVGKWQDTEEGVDVEAVASWTENGRFLLRSFIIRDPDSSDMKVSELIGWDPSENIIRSWVFDSDGGFGQSTWRQRGDEWLILARAVLPDGGKASAIQILRPIDEDTFIWSSTNREADGHMLPDIEEIRFVRVGGEPTADASQGRQP
jgi:uncharacterized protein (TIGR02246 family)